MHKDKKCYVLCRTIDPQLSNLILSENYPHLTFKGKVYPRDNLSRYRWVNLKRILNEYNFHLENEEFFQKNNKKADIEFHFFSKIPTNNKKKYLILPEHEFIDSCCSKKNNLDYTKVFTNIKNDVDNKTFFYINWPNDFSDHVKKNSKKKFICLINSNKNLNRFDYRSGYSKRSKIIKWFMHNAPDKLDLYGQGWDNYFSCNYYLNRALSALSNKLNINFRYQNPVYKGFINNTKNTIKDYKFMICFENIFDFEGYTGNAMMDALNAITVPIYLGRPDISEAVPKKCFIDYRDFKNNTELLKYCENMKDHEYNEYVKNIKNFVSSNKNQECNIERFSHIIINHLKKDLKNNDI